MILTNVSFLGQSTSQISRLKDLNATLADLQRQIASGKKTDTLAGFGGTVAQSIQRVRTDRGRVQSYIDNIATANNRIKQMSEAMTAARKAATQLIDGLASAVHESSTDIKTLATLAKQSLAFVQDLANLNVDGRYLFAGSDTGSAPFTDANLLDANMQAQVAGWLNGSSTTAQMTGNIEGFSLPQIGFNPGLSAAGPVSLRIDDGTELDYTVRADVDGFQDVIRALGFMAHLKVPGPADTPTNADLDEALKGILSLVQQGAEKLDAAQTSLGAKSSLIKAVQEKHERDAVTLDGLIHDIENADMTEAIAKVQSLQTQLQASYQVTSILNELSLVNFL